MARKPKFIEPPDTMNGIMDSETVSELAKAQAQIAGGRLVDVQDPKKKSPATKFFDPMYVLDFLSHKTKNQSWSISYLLLRKISYRSGVIASVINTRLNQVAMFAHPYLTPNDRIGYYIVPTRLKFENLRRQTDPSYKVRPITQEELDKLQEVMSFIEHCGIPETMAEDPLRESFRDFIKKVLRDSMTFDQLCFEIVKDPKTKKPIAFYPVDAGTIRIADVKTQQEKGFAYVQWIDGVIHTAYKPDEMAFAVRNPVTDIKAHGYGISEIEMAFNYISSQMYAETYNSKFFTQGSTPKGLLNIRGSSIPQEELESFRRAWHAQLAGVGNAWKTPILASEGVEWVNLNASNREMEYGRWMEYLVNVICAIYQIDPVEVNFPNKGGVAGQSKSLSDSSTLERIKFSKDKGLVPLLKFFEGVMNKYIINPLTNGEFEFLFYGYTDTLDDMKSVLEQREGQYLKTVNEIRAGYGLPEIKGGDVILNPTYVQYRGQIEMQEMQQQQMEMENQQAQAGTGPVEGAVPPESQQTPDQVAGVAPEFNDGMAQEFQQPKFGFKSIMSKLFK